ncbi:uracil-DNA glycosylase [Chengkuizengella axinellae]|uniref:Uracil-DNA glycosylase n=1 Tax=Chengkuizengella axinellae TaxID=3064388 RepID=A0ABT9IZG6_9BACL|nr:uracil-DNA glycosylase [Chengkuizengella sp. 2205SS18-9]MDP5274765.1 uracil-DNA glycosylase [Chengkuizengella sp. 2205SS18-9]
MNINVPNLNNDWTNVLKEEFEKDYYQQLMQFLREEYESSQVIYPKKEHILNALQYTSYGNTKVVILGQDPYHGPNQAHGLSFSVQHGIQAPPSLKNIFKELSSDIDCLIPEHGCLEKWAEQGVLLLNTVLTVREGQAHSHKGKGWETFTDQVITSLNERQEPVVFILWGRPAQMKRKLITAPQHHIIASPHPSPLSAHRGFFGSKPFSKVNEFLREMGKEEIDWGRK